jgi:hypothetical protein
MEGDLRIVLNSPPRLLTGLVPSSFPAFPSFPPDSTPECVGIVLERIEDCIGDDGLPFKPAPTPTLVLTDNSSQLFFPCPRPLLFITPTPLTSTE